MNIPFQHARPDRRELSRDEEGEIKAALFESMGVSTGIDLDGLLATAEFCEQVLGRELNGRVTRSGLNPLR